MTAKESWTNLKNSYATGKTKSYEWRIEQLNGIRRFMKENEVAFAEAAAKDLGRHKFETVALEAGAGGMELDYIIANLKTWMKTTPTSIPALFAPAVAEIGYEPLGCCLIIAPFNYPFVLALSPLFGAIAAGNCVLVKPSDMTPAVEKLIFEELPKYVDNDCIKTITGGIDVSTDLLNLRWDKIFFTGSTRVGKIVLKAAAENLTPVALELGGKSPTIIDESITDMDVVSNRVAWGKCVNAGQTCIAPDYVFCHEKHYDAFMKAVKEKFQKFYGDDKKASPYFARIVTSAHCSRLKQMLEENKDSVYCGGNVSVEERYVEPTVLQGVSMESKVMQEEIFGPILPVIKYSNIDEVIDFVNKGEKPLALYIFAKNRKLIDKVTNSVTSGSYAINDVLFQFGNFFYSFRWRGLFRHGLLPWPLFV